MAKTVLTSATTLLSAAEYLKRRDWRRVADLVSDTDARPTEASLASNANLAACLLDATGVCEQAALKGGRYTPADLAALTGAAQAAMYRLLTHLTDWFIADRRPADNPMPPACQWAFDQIGLLEQGQRIFGFQETADAGRTDHEVESDADVVDRNGIVVQAERFFGRRSNRVD